MQEDFNTDIAWLVATGIEGKMKRELEKILPSYWTMPTYHELVPLSLVHLVLSFLFGLCGLGLATIVFVIETVYHKFQTQTESLHPKSLRKKKTRADKIGNDIIHPGHKESDVKDIIKIVDL